LTTEAARLPPALSPLAAGDPLNWGPTEEWLPIDKVWIPGHERLANHITR
jgi:hypothetical protein